MKHLNKFWGILASGTNKESRAINDEAVQSRSGKAVLDDTDTSIGTHLQPCANSGNNYHDFESGEKLASSAMVATVTQVQDEINDKNITPQTASLPLSGADIALFGDEVEIGVLPPVDTTQFSRLTRKLDDVPQLRILKINGYWDEGYIITVLIDEPLPVIGLLKEIAEVEKAHLWTDGEKGSDGYFPGWIAFTPTPGGLKGNRLVIKLRKDPLLSAR